MSSNDLYISVAITAQALVFLWRPRLASASVAAMAASAAMAAGVAGAAKAASAAEAGSWKPCHKPCTWYMTAVEQVAKRMLQVMPEAARDALFPPGGLPTKFKGGTVIRLADPSGLVVRQADVENNSI